MQFKLVPEPADSLERIAELQSAVPLVPDQEASCCARLVEATTLESEADAREWLTFLRALGLAEETGGNYRRLPRPADPGELGDAFEERVYPAGEVLSILADADGPLSLEAVLEALEDRSAGVERLRRGDEGPGPREQLRRVLEWSVCLGLARRVEGGYVAE